MSRLLLILGMILWLCAVPSNALAGGTSLADGQNLPEKSTDSSPVKDADTIKLVEPSKAPVVDSIEIIGLRQMNSQTVLNKLQSKKGELFSQSILEEDIRRLYESNLFFKIDWKVEDVVAGEKVKIILTVEESVMILEVKFEGMNEFSLSALKGVLKINDNSALNTFLVKADIKALIDKYLEKGYYFVDINYRVDKGVKGNRRYYFQGKQIIPGDIIRRKIVFINEVIFHSPTVQSNEADFWGLSGKRTCYGCGAS